MASGKRDPSRATVRTAPVPTGRPSARKTAPKNTSQPPKPLDDLPGHHIRRLQQIAVSSFMAETADLGITPVQFAALATVARQPGVDQRSLARAIAFDTSTLGGVVDRLEKRGLMLRSASAHDKRVRLLNLTSEGKSMLARIEPGMLRAQQRMLQPLSEHDRVMLMRLLKKVVDRDDAQGSND